MGKRPFHIFEARDYGSLLSQGRPRRKLADEFIQAILMIMPRRANAAGDVVIAGGEFHAGAGGLLADGGAIEFLPRRLVGRVGKTALGLQFGAPPIQLLVRYQDVGATLVEVDANLVAGLQNRKAAVGGGFGRGVEDRRRAR